jgi:hypothetical protein
MGGGWPRLLATGVAERREVMARTAPSQSATRQGHSPRDAQRREGGPERERESATSRRSPPRTAMAGRLAFRAGRSFLHSPRSGSVSISEPRTGRRRTAWGASPRTGGSPRSARGSWGSRPRLYAAAPRGAETKPSPRKRENSLGRAYRERGKPRWRSARSVENPHSLTTGRARRMPTGEPPLVAARPRLASNRCHPIPWRA